MIKDIIEFVFTFALFINALLFVPQAITIFKNKTAVGLSLTTFLGFLLIQFAIVLHGTINKDYLLLAGYLLSMAACGSVVVLMLIYRKSNQQPNANISLEEALEQLPAHVYWKDKNGVYLGCNDLQALSYNLKNRNEIVGKTDFDFFNEKDAKEVRENDAHVIHIGESLKMEEPVKMGGKHVTMLSQKIPLRNKKDEIIGILGVSIDITNSKQEIEDRLAMLENIIAVMPGHVYWVSPEGYYLGCNDQQAKSSGLTSREEIIGKRNKDLPWNSNATMLPDALDKINNEVMKMGKAVTIEEPATLMNGAKKIFLSNKVPLVNNRGDITGMVGISIDITKEKQAQKALEEANNARLEFISTASHEVRGPVSNVILLEDFLEKNIATLQDFLEKEGQITDAIAQKFSKIFEQCQDIRSETENALNALKNLGDLHRMQLKGVSTHLEYCDIQKLVDVAINNCTYPNTNHIETVINIEPTVPKGIVIDFQNIIAALSIVIGNAFRFSHPNGKIIIQIRKSSKKPEGLLVVSVEDFGEGMHEAQINNLSRTLLDGKTKEESIYIKPSIQLSRVKMYVEASGGSLEINSVLDQGTTVQLFVPYKPSEEKKYVTSAMEEYLEAEEQPTKAAEICYILLVEDNSTVRKTIYNLLIQLNYRVDTAENGTDAIQMALENDYDIVLLDISLPDINGLDVMRKVHEVKKDKMTFIAVSSHSSEDDEDYFMSQGAMTLLAKPIQEKQLVDAINMALQIKTL